MAALLVLYHFRIIAVLIYAVISTPIYGAAIPPSSVYYVSDDPSANYECPTNVTSCHIYCNVAQHQNNLVFDCKNALKCYFHCDAKQCGAHSMLNAINSKILYSTQSAQGDECLYSANVVSPLNGSAFLSSLSTKGYIGTRILASANTKEIKIDLSHATPDINGSEYIGMNVFAANADYLRIDIGANLQWNSSTVECPVDSSYNGPDLAPCVINAADAVMDDISIIAPKGTPTNVIIEACAECNNVHVICRDIDKLNGANKGYIDEYPFMNTSNCWWTNDSLTSSSIITYSTIVEDVTHANNTKATFLPFPIVYFIIAVIGAIVCFIICCCIVCKMKTNNVLRKEINDLEIPKKGTIDIEVEEKIQMELCYNVPYVEVNKNKEHKEESHVKNTSSWTYTGIANLFRRFTAAKSPESKKSVALDNDSDSDDDKNLQDKQ